MKVLLLAGGFGTRLSEETDVRPKPMAEIGGKPILWHIMKMYSSYGFNEFVILLGYKGYYIKEYFANYFLHQSDVTIDLSTNRMEVHNNSSEPWKVTLLETGLHTMTGGRILRAKEFIGNDGFLLTYGDGVADIDLKALIDFHRQHKKKITMTAVQPDGRFGALQTDSNNRVISFMEKPRGDGSWINGGFFVCDPGVLDYIEGDQTVFEQQPLERLAVEGELYTYQHKGFWKCMDTLRDKVKLNELWETGEAKWKKVIVTGHTGFKGAWLTTWLLQQGAIVTGISKDIPSVPSLFEELALHGKITHYLANICDAAKMKAIFTETRPDFVFHLAAQPIVSVSYDDPVDTLQTNVMGTANVLEALRHLQDPCIAVIITSDKCYDNVEWIWGYRENDSLGGKDPYSASKGAAELIIKTYFYSFFNKPESVVKIVSVRAGNVIGGGDWALNRIVPDCVRAWSAGNPVKIRNPRSTRPWQHVLEPLSGYLRAAQVLSEGQVPIHGEAFNIGPAAEQNHTVLELLEAISHYWKFETSSAHFAVENNNLFHEAGLLKLNCDKALTYLQWKPVLDFAQTARFTGVWYNHYYNGKAAELYDFTVSQIREYEEQAKFKKLAWT